MPAAARVRRPALVRRAPAVPISVPLVVAAVALLAVGAVVAGCTGDGSPPDSLASRSTGTVDFPEPPLVVLDTDLGSDIDDALALAMLHRYADLGLVELAGVTVSRPSAAAARYARTVNGLAGRPDIPVGIDRASLDRFDDDLSYISLADDLAAALPDGPVDEHDPPDGVDVLRDVLARAVEEEREVTIIQVGFAGNVAALLASPSDDHSDLDGLALVAAADAELSVMAGSFVPPIGGSGVRSPASVEFNVAGDIDGAARVLADWPGDLVLSPFQVGDALPVPYAAVARLDPTDPLRRVYEFRDLEWHVDAPPFYDMRSWDLTSVLQAVEADGGWLPLSAPGTVRVDEAGRTTFVPGAGRHRIIEIEPLDGAARQRVVDRLVEMAVDPPG